MATANPAPAAAPRTPRRRRWLLAGLALVALALAVFWRPLAGYAAVGSAYAARVACSCRFVGGRSLENCENDFEPGMELVMLSEDASAKRVTARFPLLASETATYREGWGCVLEPWED